MSGKNYGYIHGSAGKRYPRYFRCLRELLMNGALKVSSAELAERLAVTPSQVRSDLSVFEGAGQQGYGYNVKLLYTEISRELGVGDGMTAVIVGGDGSLAAYLEERFAGRGLTVTAHAVSDGNESDGGKRIAYRTLAAFLAEHPTDLVVVLERLSDDLSEVLLRGCVKGVWNMTLGDLILPVPVLNLPVGDILMSLMCDIRHGEGKGEEE